MENSPARSCRSSEIFMVLLLGKLIPSLSQGPKEQHLHTEPDLLLLSQHHRGEHGYKLSCSGNSLQQGLETPCEDGMVQIHWEVYRIPGERKQGSSATVSPMSEGLLSPRTVRPFGGLLREGSLLTHAPAQGRFHSMAGSPNPTRRNLPPHTFHGQRIQHHSSVCSIEPKLQG